MGQPGQNVTLIKIRDGDRVAYIIIDNIEMA